MSELPKMQRVESSALSEVAYNAETEELIIRFASGKVYVYYGVDEETYIELLNESSPGSYFGSCIGGAFECVQISKRELHLKTTL